MTIERVAVTGGNGTIGGGILRELSEHGYGTVNVSRGSRDEDVADEYLEVDLLEAGAVYGALARTDVDAVVHMATIPSPVHHPGYETYRSNVQTSYHVLEAATELALERVVLPSSVNVVGSGYQDAPMEVEYLPVDEAHPVTPRDPYALGKHAMEVTADGFGRLPDAPPIASLRYPWVAPVDEIRARYAGYGDDAGSLDPDWLREQRDGLFVYLCLADAARVARRALEADFDGHERFWTVAADTSTRVPTERLVAECYPDAAVRAPLADHDALVSVEKARDVLAWEPRRSWREP